MIINEKRRIPEVNKGYVKNEYLEEDIGRIFNHCRCIFITSMAGSGKTWLMSSYLKNRFKAVGYYSLDEDDNNQQSFLEALESILKDMSLSIEGIRLPLNSKYLVIRLQKLEGSGIIILDNFQYIQDREILDFIYRAIELLPKNIVMVFLSRRIYPKILGSLIAMGKIEALNAKNIFFNNIAIREVLSTQGIKVSEEELKVIVKKTAGWPLGVVFMTGLINKTHKGIHKFMEEEVFAQYIDREIWGYLSKDERNLIDIILAVNTASMEMIEDIGEIKDKRIAESLVASGILSCNNSCNEYCVLPILKDFIFKYYRKAEDNKWISYSKSIKLRAASWLLNKARGFEALRLYYELGDRQAIQSLLENEYSSLEATIGVKDLGTYLSNLEEKIIRSRPRLMYLQGAVFIMEGKFNQGEAIINELKKENSKKRNYEIDEIILNLIFMSPFIDNHMLLEYLKDIPKNGEFNIYCINLLTDRLLFCKRDLSSILYDEYIGNINAEDYRIIFSKKTWIKLRLLKLEFLYEINDRDEYREALYNLMSEGMESYSFEDKAYILSLIDRVNITTGFENYITGGFKTLRNEIYSNNRKNIAAKRLLAERAADNIIKGRVSEGIDWFIGCSPYDGERINNDNLPMIMAMGRIYIKLSRYKEALFLFELMAVYAKRHNHKLLQAVALYGVAISLYGLEDKSTAIKRMIESLTISLRYQYIYIYIGYGHMSEELLQDYIRFIFHDGKKRKRAYKRATDGKESNTLDSYNSYIEAILKEVQRVNEMYNENWVSQEKIEGLTLSELKVVQLINQGKSNKDIAIAMEIKLPTVKTHIYNIFNKLNVKSRTQAIGKARLLGIVEK